MEPFFLGSYDEIVAHHLAAKRVDAERIRELTDGVLADWNLSREETMLLLALYQQARGDCVVEASVETVSELARLGKTDGYFLLRALEEADYLRTFSKHRAARYVALRRTVREVGERPLDWKPSAFKRPKSATTAAIDSAAASTLQRVRHDLADQVKSQLSSNSESGKAESVDLKVEAKALKVKVDLGTNKPAQKPAKQKLSEQAIAAEIAACREQLASDPAYGEELVKLVERAIADASLRKRDEMEKKSRTPADLTGEEQLLVFWKVVASWRSEYPASWCVAAMKEALKKGTPGETPGFKKGYFSRIWHSYPKGCLARWKSGQSNPPIQQLRKQANPAETARAAITTLLKQAAAIADQGGSDEERFQLRDQALTHAPQVASLFGGDQSLAERSIREAIKQAADYFVGIKPLRFYPEDYDPSFTWDARLLVVSS